jgi:hypothetical protein
MKRTVEAMQKRTRNRLIVFFATITVMVSAGVVFQMRRVKAATELPTAVARKGEFLVLVQCRGELTARKSQQITAPRNIPDLQIL